MFSPESRSSTFSATEKDEEEAKKDDRSHRATDNRSRPSSIVLEISIDTVPDIIGDATTSGGGAITSGGNRNAGRFALLAIWVSRIEGMCDLLTVTGKNNLTTTGHKRIREAIHTLTVR